MKTILVFHAKWCGPCKVYSQIIDKFEKSHTDVGIKHYDVDDSDELVQKYGIRGVPTTIVLDEDENILYRKSGIIQESELIEMIK